MILIVTCCSNKVLTPNTLKHQNEALLHDETFRRDEFEIAWCDYRCYKQRSMVENDHQIQVFGNLAKKTSDFDLPELPESLNCRSARGIFVNIYSQKLGLSPSLFLGIYVLFVAKNCQVLKFHFIILITNTDA